jgi:zinc transport system substrate-binding protein
MKKFKILAVVLVVLFILVEVFIFNKSKKSQVQKPIVTVSSFFLYDITKHIAKDKVEIVNILPFGVDPHSFEMTPDIMSKIEHSNLVFYSGAGLEPWVDRIKFKSKAIDMSKYVKLRKLDSNEFEFHKHHDEQCAHNTLDPHYWLNFDNMRSATRVVTNELIELEPKNKNMFLKNRDIYLAMLQKLDDDYTKALASCRVDHLILNHNSMGYVAQKYHFHSESLSGLSPESQPTPNDIKRIINEITENGITTIFFENFVSSKVVKTIASDTGIKVDVIESLGNITADEAKANVTYEELMYKNLKKLSKALVCN